MEHISPDIFSKNSKEIDVRLDEQSAVDVATQRLFRGESIVDLVPQLDEESLRVAYSNALFQRLRENEEIIDLCIVPLSDDVKNSNEFRLLLKEHELSKINGVSYGDDEKIYSLQHLSSIGLTAEYLINDDQSAHDLAVYVRHRILNNPTDLEDVKAFRLTQDVFSYIYSAKLWNRLIRAKKDDNPYLLALKSIVNSDEEFIRLLARLSARFTSLPTLRIDLEMIGVSKEVCQSNVFLREVINFLSASTDRYAAGAAFSALNAQFPQMRETSNANYTFKTFLENGLYCEEVLPFASPDILDSQSCEEAKVLWLLKTLRSGHFDEDIAQRLKISSSIFEKNEELSQSFLEMFREYLLNSSWKFGAIVSSFVDPSFFLKEKIVSQVKMITKQVLFDYSSLSNIMVALDHLPQVREVIANDAEVQELLFKWMDGQIRAGLDIRDVSFFKLDEQKFHRFISKQVFNALHHDPFRLSRGLKPYLRTELGKDPSIVGAARKSLKRFFSSEISHLPPFKEMGLSVTALYDDELVAAARGWIIKRLGDKRSFRGISLEYLPQDISEDQEVQASVTEAVIARLEMAERYEDLLPFCKGTKLAERKDVQQAALKGLYVALRTSHLLSHVLENYPLPLYARRAIEVAKEIFGNDVSHFQMELLLTIEGGNRLSNFQLDVLKGTGLEKFQGQQLLSEIRTRVGKVRTGLLEGSLDPSFHKTPFYADIVRSMVRADIAEWGGGQFNELVESYERQELRDGSVHVCKPGYVASESLSIKKSQPSKIELSKACTERFAILKSDLAETIDIFFESKPYTHLASRLDKKRIEIIEGLQERLLVAPNEKAKEHAQKSIDSLSAIQIRSIKDLEMNFTLLAKFKEAEPLLRQLLFFKSLHDHKVFYSQACDLVRSKNPSMENLVWLSNYITHVTHRDTWQRYFSDKSARDAFKFITSTVALDEEVKRFGSSSSVRTTQMKFVPSRGLLLEFSGHIGDACWAGQENIALSHPNITSVTMVMSPGTKNERLAGSALLIEAEARDGSPLLVVRAINPLENIISQLNPESFVSNFFDYAKKIAKNTNRKLAFVVDSRGQASTNRQIIADYLNGLNGLKRVEYENASQATFNGYELDDSTYYVPE